MTEVTGTPAFLVISSVWEGTVQAYRCLSARSEMIQFIFSFFGRQVRNNFWSLLLFKKALNLSFHPGFLSLSYLEKRELCGLLTVRQCSTNHAPWRGATRSGRKGTFPNLHRDTIGGGRGALSKSIVSSRKEVWESAE